MDKRVDLDFIGTGNAAEAYGSLLQAWSFKDIKGENWFQEFRQDVISAIGKCYFPVYRMADGEYRFLLGRRFDPHRKARLREIAAILATKLSLFGMNKCWTSWGEVYTSGELKILRKKYVENLKFISEHGCLALYINDNGLNAFVHYNKTLMADFAKFGIGINENNYVPFHFPCHLLMAEQWQEFYRDRNILIVTGITTEKSNKILSQLKAFGANAVHFCKISSTGAMKEHLDLSSIPKDIDIAFVAAGVGAANIISQLSSIKGPVIDIGGYMECFSDQEFTYHGGIFKLPPNDNTN